MTRELDEMIESNVPFIKLYGKMYMDALKKAQEADLAFMREFYIETAEEYKEMARRYIFGKAVLGGIV